MASMVMFTFSTVTSALPDFLCVLTSSCAAIFSTLEQIVVMGTSRLASSRDYSSMLCPISSIFLFLTWNSSCS